MNKILPFLLLFSSYSFASDVCVRTQAQIKHNLSNEFSRIAFKNSGGLFNGGVCWWHSRLQRSSIYLARFRPDSPPPTPQKLQVILRDLKSMRKVVTIPGYSDFYTFTRDYQKEVQSLLNLWQKEDGFLNLEWVRGISGQSSLTASEMRARMLNLYSHYKSSPTPLWIMAQIKGITSHSLLVLDMVQTENGFDLSVIDSNHPLMTVSIPYHDGDQFLKAPGESYSFVPYVGFQKDFNKISRALKSECRGFIDPLDVEDLQDGDIEID